MSEIELAFTSENVDAVHDGKDMTLRRSRHGKIGDTFRIGRDRYELTGIVPGRLEDLARNYWPRTGANSAEDVFVRLERAYGMTHPPNRTHTWFAHAFRRI